MQLDVKDDLEYLELQTFEVEDLLDLGLMAPQELVENTESGAACTFCSCSTSSCCSCSTSCSSTCSCSCSAPSCGTACS